MLRLKLIWVSKRGFRTSRKADMFPNVINVGSALSVQVNFTAKDYQDSSLSNNRQVVCSIIGMSWWRHRMETFLSYWPLWGESAGHRWIPLTNGHWRGALFFICAWRNGWANNQRRLWFQTSRSLWHHCNALKGKLWLTTLKVLAAFSNFSLWSSEPFQDKDQLTQLSMMTSSNGNIFRVIGPFVRGIHRSGEFPAQRPVTRGFDVFFDLRLNHI